MNTYTRIADLYDRFLADGYSELAQDPKAYPLRPVLEKLKKYEVLQKGKSVLDLGCGPGLLKEYTAYKYYAGVDLSTHMLHAAADRGYSELIQSPLEEYVGLLPDNSFDSVFCFSVTYLMSPAAVKELVEQIDRIAKEFWLITFDGIPENLTTEYIQAEGLHLHNHIGLEISDVTDRFIIKGWKSAIDGKAIPMEVVLKKK